MLVRFIKDLGGWAEGDIRESEGHELDQLLLNGIVEPVEGDRKPAAQRKVRKATAPEEGRTAAIEE